MMSLIPPAISQIITLVKYVLKVCTLNFETYIMLHILTQNKTFKLRSKQFDKDKVNINKEVQTVESLKANKK